MTRIQNHNRLSGFALRRHKFKHNSHNFSIQLPPWLPEATVSARLQWHQAGTTITTHLPLPRTASILSAESQDQTQHVCLQLQALPQHHIANQGGLLVLLHSGKSQLQVQNLFAFQSVYGGQGGVTQYFSKVCIPATP